MTLTNLIWNLTIIIGCSYLVFIRDFSGWWFLLAIILLNSDKE